MEGSIRPPNVREILNGNFFAQWTRAGGRPPLAGWDVVYHSETIEPRSRQTCAEVGKRHAEHLPYSH